jgi:tetratricopeptide (TPR) repeat protein
VGDGHRRIVELLVARVDAVANGDVKVPRIVILEGASGLGKSRVVREVYREMRARRDPRGYWPALDESGGNDARSRDPLPGRKRVGPDVEHFLWPAGVLPAFAWWQMHCERMQGGELVDVAAQARAQIAAHLVPVALAWREAASLKEKAAAKKGDMATAAREALREGGIEAASRVLATFDVVIPGLGLAASWAMRGVASIKDLFDERSDVRADIDLGQRADEQRRSVSAELAGVLRGVAHREVPAIVVIEDLHLMGEALAELLDLLSSADAARPAVVVGTAWPQSNVSTTYTRWRSIAVTSGRVQVVTMPHLQQAELVRIVRAYAPNTNDASAAQAADQFPNPLSLEVTLSLKQVQDKIAQNDGALPPGALSAQSPKLKGVYRDQFWELSEQVQVALSTAAGAVPESRSRVWPFVRGVVAESAQRCADIPADAANVLAGIEHAAEDNVWLVPSGVADSFREALQAQVAYEHFQDVLAGDETGSLRDAVAEVLIERIDSARGDGYVLDDTDESTIISRWLLEIDSATDARGALLAAAFHEAQSLARTYQFRAAVDTLAPRLASHPSSDVRDILRMRLRIAGWYAELGLTSDTLATLEALEVDQRRILGPDHVDTLRTQNRQASALQAAGRTGDAIAAYETLIPRLVHVLGPAHRITLASRNNLAIVLTHAGCADNAIAAYEELLNDLAAAYGPTHPDTLTTRHNLAGALSKAGREEDAANEYEKVLNQRLKTVGPHHPDTLITRHNLAGAIDKMGRTEDAIEAYRRLSADQLRIIGADHINSFLTRHELAIALERAARHDEALVAFKQLIDDQVRAIGPDHPYTLTARNNLAIVLGQAGRSDEAITTFDHLLADRIRVQGRDHFGTRSTQRNLALELARAGRIDEARTAFEELLRDQLRVLGTDHPDTLATRANIDFLLQEKDDPGAPDIDVRP